MLLNKLGSNPIKLVKILEIRPLVLPRHLRRTFADADVVDLAYAVYGSSTGENSSQPPLLILHGLLGSKNNWKSMSQAIHSTTGRKVITVDARNHGESKHSLQHTYRNMVQDVINLLKTLEISKVSLMGHSMGGRTAMVLSLLFADVVSSLIVVDISPVTTSRQIYSSEHFIDAMANVTIPPGTAMSKARKLADEQLKKATADSNIRNFLLLNLIQSKSGEYTWAVNLRALKENFRTHISSFPSDLKGEKYIGPTLFIGGSLSDYIGKDDLPAIKEYFPNAELVFVDGSGHWVHSEKPKKFLEIVQNYLREH